MCGIAGVFHYADPDCPIDRELLVRMTRSLAHRGPDAEDFHIGRGIGLGHRRLSIVDLSPTGAQPMPNDDQTRWIVYNGEFYNHREFRPRLEARGVRFRGSSDTETMLRLLENEGPDCLAETAGIFGFAYWDSTTRTLTLVRDHMGVKQVYYHDNGKRILFASEIKALLQDPAVPREMDPEAVNQYLHFHTPLFDRTFFKGIGVLRAGEYMRVNCYGTTRRTYWAIRDFTKISAPAEQVVEQLREGMTSVVGGQLMSDVPVGAFFSGGIDSSAIAAHAAMAGPRPQCFGVHFTDQGVIDERPYQEAAAKALNLDLHLITMDGTDFPDEFRRLTWHQDQPVIGAALFPMAKVSQLASQSVKVCLGGQAADEIFGGYARYALSHPLQVVQSWFEGRRGLTRETSPGSNRESAVGGNLFRQFAQGKTITRLARNVRFLANWEASYFEHFSRIPESTWRRLLASPDFCSRDRAREIFHETLARSSATDPLDKIMHWDVQGYLTGLFQQDDRMSMASSLESRVPFADPRIVQFAFRLKPGMKLRSGASKWILRQAVSNVLPPFVLNRRKVGFDTPADRWIQDTHFDFVRETLLSREARHRGIWNPAAIETFLEHRGASEPFDVIWKALSIELWASVFLDSRVVPIESNPVAEAVSSPAASRDPEPFKEKLGHLLQECRELGVGGTLARGMWELKTRSGFAKVTGPARPSADPGCALPSNRIRLPFSPSLPSPEILAAIMSRDQKEALSVLANEATKGRILCFNKWFAECGSPIDWHRDPVTGHRWKADAHWTRVLANAPGVDVKFTWEAARFPQAYLFARAAAANPESAADLYAAFESQVIGFIDANPLSQGIHWFSGQEVAFRIFAWLFGVHVFSQLGLATPDFLARVSESLYDAGAHIAEHIEYARDSVYNNHLLSEALGLYVVGRLFDTPECARWAEEGHRLLTAHADFQVYPDGSYIQQAHNYHRVAMQIYLWATSLVRANSEREPDSWRLAMDRSLDFLYLHQNDTDGHLPNYGSNDGSLPVQLAQSEFGDFRPVLQALSVAVHGARLYERGPWDEMSLWLFGPETMALPQRPITKRSFSFNHTGHHVLRGMTGSFGALRCGTIIDRFSQIDMLHLDVWWRGQNVLVDAGSFRYNGAPHWHNHFLRTECHNTVRIDGRDQMVHFRQFKTLYWTKAALLRFEDSQEFTIAEGEHYGYRRNLNCTHRRSVLFVKDDLWIVVDTMLGTGVHNVVLQWLGAPFPWTFDPAAAQMTINSPAGPFYVAVVDDQCKPIDDADVVAGHENPIRGWQSRYYGAKTPVPSFHARAAGSLPISMISVLSGGVAKISKMGQRWTAAGENALVEFEIVDGRFQSVSVAASGVKREPAEFSF